jgi:hypothetical protein
MTCPAFPEIDPGYARIFFVKKSIPTTDKKRKPAFPQPLLLLSNSG